MKTCRPTTNDIMNTMKPTNPPGSDKYMVGHGYRIPSREERLIYGSLVQRETIPSIFAGWIKRSFHRPFSPRSAGFEVDLVPAPAPISEKPLIPEWEPQECVEEFAGDPKLRFEVRSINVDGHEVGALRYFGVPDLMDDLFLDGKCEVYGLALLK
jgi:hypothetical protein